MIGITSWSDFSVLLSLIKRFKEISIGNHTLLSSIGNLPYSFRFLYCVY